MSAPSTAELLARADLAGRARVVAVRETAAHGRIAILRFIEFTKAPPPAQMGFFRRLLGMVVVSLPPAGTPASLQATHGRWSGGYRPGDTVMTHLCWNAETRTYQTVSWNAVWLTPSA